MDSFSTQYTPSKKLTQYSLSDFRSQFIVLISSTWNRAIIQDFLNNTILDKLFYKYTVYKGVLENNAFNLLKIRNRNLNETMNNKTNTTNNFQENCLLLAVHVLLQIPQ